MLTVKLRYIRHSAKKLRPYARVIKGQGLEQAILKTAVMTQDSAKFLNKALLMAKASAQAKEFIPETLVVGEIMATEGPRIKRIRANARGRTNRYQKHLAHLTISLTEKKTDVKTVALKKVIKKKESTNGSKN